MANTVAWGPVPGHLRGRVIVLERTRTKALGPLPCGAPGRQGPPELGAGGAAPRLVASELARAPSLLTQRRTRSSASPQGRVELEPRPAAIPPPCCWVTACPLRPRLPQPSCLPSARPLADTWAQVLGCSFPVLPSAPPGIGPLTLCLEPAGSFEGQITSAGCPQPALPCTVTSPGEAGTPPTRARALAHVPCWEQREAGAQSVSAPGSQRPRGQPGTGWRLAGGPLL